MKKSYTLKEVRQRAETILSQPATIRFGTINEFCDMAEGGDANGIRQQYYPGKSDSFFKEVLAIIDGGE